MLPKSIISSLSRIRVASMLACLFVCFQAACGNQGTNQQLDVSVPPPLPSKFEITEPVHGSSIRAEDVVCKGIMRFPRGAKSPEILHVELIRAGDVVDSKAAILENTDNAGEYRFEVPLSRLVSNGDYTIRVQGTISSANLVKVGDPSPASVSVNAMPVSFTYQAMHHAEAKANN